MASGCMIYIRIPNSMKIDIGAQKILKLYLKNSRGHWYYRWDIFMIYAFEMASRSIIYLLNCMKILSRIGYVTRRISSLCQECSGYLLCYLYTLIHFSISISCSTIYVGESIQLSPLTARLRLSSLATISRLLSSEVNARLVWLMCSFSYICGRCYSMNLLL
jgi:hypothetical protein